MNADKEEASVLASLGCDFEEDLQHDRHTEWKACSAEDHPDRQLVFSEDVAQQLGGGVSDLGLREEVALGCDVRHEPDDFGHLVERAQVASRDGEYVQSSDARGFTSLFYVVFSAEPAYELRFMSDHGENSAEVKQVTGLDTFNISA